MGSVHQRAPDRGRKPRQRLVGAGKPARVTGRGTLRRCGRQLPPLARRPRPDGAGRLHRLPLRDRVGPRRACRRLLLPGRGRPLRARRPGRGRTRPAAADHPAPFHRARVVRGRRRLEPGRRGDALPALPGRRRAGHRRRGGAGHDDQRAEYRGRTPPAHRLRCRPAGRTAGSGPGPHRRHDHRAPRRGCAAPGAAPGARSGWGVAVQDYQAEPGGEEALASYVEPRDGVFLRAAADDDYIGVQAYSRVKITRRRPAVHRHWAPRGRSPAGSTTRRRWAGR